MSSAVHGEDERALLLELARQSIVETLAHGRLPTVRGDYLPPGFDEPRACFVTLTLAGRLRGCMGNLEPKWPLYRAVMENARSAATRDPRFAPLSLDELRALRLEISLLSPPVKLRYQSPADLCAQLRRDRPGVILRAWKRSATYLPQVWDKQPDPEAFLANLAQKAGLDADAWRLPECEILTYTVEAFAEPETLRPPGTP